LLRRRQAARCCLSTQQQAQEEHHAQGDFLFGKVKYPGPSSETA
jgi:Tfp pilus assembly protein PilE